MRKIEEYDNYCFYYEPHEQTESDLSPEDTDKFLLKFLTWDCEQLYRCDALKAFSTIPLCDDCPHKSKEVKK